MQSCFRVPSKKFLALISTSVLIAATVSYFVWPSQPEGPHYKGHSLSYWVQQVDSNSAGDSFMKAKEAAAAAGIEGEAWLIWAMEYGKHNDDQSWTFRRMAKLNRSFPAIPAPVVYDQRLVSWYLLHTMQPPPKAAIPPAIRMLQSKEDIISQAGAYLLYRLQPASYPALIQSSRSGLPLSRERAIDALSRRQLYSNQPIPYISSETETAQVIDALLAALHDSSTAVRRAALLGVESYLPLAEPTLSAVMQEVTQAAQDPDPSVQAEAKLTLEKIQIKLGS